MIDMLQLDDLSAPHDQVTCVVEQYLDVLAEQLNYVPTLGGSLRVMFSNSKHFLVFCLKPTKLVLSSETLKWNDRRAILKLYTYYILIFLLTFEQQ